MSKTEDTPFVIDFRQKNTGNYGSAVHIRDTPTTSNNISLSSSSNNSSGSNNNSRRLPPTTPTTTYCLHGKSRHVEVRDHCHRQRTEGIDVNARKKLIIASGLCLFFMICEVIGGVLSNSLAIATDAAHLLTDFASFMISLFAIWIAGRPSTQRMSFGWYRAEVIGAMASVVMIWFITAILVWLAIQRVITRDFEVDAKIMLITSGLAILVNLVMGFQLHHGHSHGGGGGHGHSHGNVQQSQDSSKKKKKKSKNVLDSAGSTLTPIMPGSTLTPIMSGTNDLDAETPKTAQTVTFKTFDSLHNHDHSQAVCPASPTERLEDGVSDLPDVDSELPTAGLQTFSYQNSRSVKEVHAEIAAVMAETAPGGHHHGGIAGKEAVNMNVRAAFIHVVGDVLQSVGVFLAALLIYFRPDWAIADPICTFIFSIIVLFTTFAIMKDALLVLMEGTPNYMHYSDVHNIFQNIEGVQRVHNLRIWALSINKVALSVHLAVDPGVNTKKILEEATAAVHLRYNFFETTIQIEDATPAMENCTQCTMPEK